MLLVGLLLSICRFVLQLSFLMNVLFCMLMSFSPLFVMVFFYFVASFSAVLLLFVADVRCLFCHLVVELEERRFLLWYAANDSKLKTENMSFC